MAIWLLKAFFNNVEGAGQKAMNQIFNQKHNINVRNIVNTSREAKDIRQKVVGGILNKAKDPITGVHNVNKLRYSANLNGIG